MQLLAGRRVVVVEDNASTQKLINEVLHAFGIGDVRISDDGAKALEIVHARPPDLILVDWHMTPMDGITFLQKLRHKSFGRGSKTKAIMLTAHTQPHLVKAAMESGANHFVAKPIVPGDLLKRIIWVMDDRRPFVLKDDHYVLSGKVSVSRQPVWIAE